MSNFVRSVATGGKISIVALGSASTAGAGASDPGACYPARLEVQLNNKYPTKHFRVINLGIAGQTASDMQSRIDPDVLSHEPTLVIWQTGVSDAVLDIGLDGFRRSLQQGIDQLKSREVDVILLDMQYYPRSERLPVYRDYLAAMKDVARYNNIPVLRRYEIMRHWIRSSRFSSEQLLATDSSHPSDLTYGCLADLLVDAIGDTIDRGLVSQRAADRR